MASTTELEVIKPGATAALMRQATDAAHVCREIVLKTAVEISGRKYVKVEGWMSIAVVHGCIASIKSVETTPDGVKAVAVLRRQSDGAELSAAEGFVGKDETTWFGGKGTRWNRAKRCEEEHIYPKRDDYAIRAMAQTRAVSRVCRTGFSHVVVLMDAGLSTVPYEEMAPHEDATPGDTGIDGKIDEGHERAKADAAKPTAPTSAPATTTKPVEVKRDAEVGLRAQFEDGKWEGVVIHFGADKGKTLGELPDKKLAWWCKEWAPKAYGGRPIGQDDLLLRAALDAAALEGFNDN